MLSGDSGQGESICTPRSVSKRLFSPGGSAGKRNLFGTKNHRAKEPELSGEESDLGPMSPLAMTDQSESSCESSPGRTFVSPFTTPEKSSPNLKAWDRLRPNTSGRSFDALKTLTKMSRASPKRKIVSQLLPGTPERKKHTVETWRVGTPEREIALLFGEEIIPETPRKDSSDDERVEETPEKRRPELATPLGSVQHNMSAPHLHRRKSLCPFDNEETSSPERHGALKRRASDNVQSVGAKVPKINETSAPKARASLFPEKSNASPPNAIDFATVSTKTFYKQNPQVKRGPSFGIPEILERTKKRLSLPVFGHNNYNNHGYHRRASIKRPTIRFGQINAGVRHGIKRPKPNKRHLSRVEAFKIEKRRVSEPIENTSQRTIVAQDAPVIQNENMPVSNNENRLPSPQADPNKRFFKTNRTLKTHNFATVTVNNKIKLKVSDGKIALNQKHIPKRKKPRIEDISFDATDLTVDEPNFENATSMEHSNKSVVDGILKVLEDDWADDDYDTMESLAISPVRSKLITASSVATMSPTSLLSDMTHSMNIKDSSTTPKADDPKLYPLFAKGYSSGIQEEDNAVKKRGIKRSWQTSIKGGGAEDQYQIDAGQKRFGAATCSECGIVYQQGDPDDENAHLIYHNNIKTLKFPGWKNERVVVMDPLTNSRIICIEPGDSKQCWKKVEQVLTVVDKDLGLADMELSSYTDKKIYFYVRDKTILGVMAAESIKVAHRMIPEFVDLNCCSAEDTPAKCGINIVWTTMSHRRKGIATKMIDTLRATYYYGHILSMDDIAFSMPTPSGKIFAEKYTKTLNFKVYS